MIPMTLKDGRLTGYKKKASKMRQYLELKTYDTTEAFWEDHNIKSWKSVSTSSMLAFPDHP
jgi:hypothetical protein